MRRFRRIMLIALASGVLAFLVVPFLVPVESTGTLSNSEAAGFDAQFVELAGLQVHIETAAYSGEQASESAGGTTGDTAGESAGGTTGESAGGTTGESAGGTTGDTAGESAGGTTGESEVESGGDVASEPTADCGCVPPLIVLLHGFGASTFSWREVMQSLATVGDVVAYDRPGFGFTERPTEWAGANPYGIPGNLELLDALIDYQLDATRPDATSGSGSNLNSEPDNDRDSEVILIGHSAGGLLAAEYARTAPDRVDRLVLVAPAITTSGGAPAWLVPVLGIPQIDRLGPLAVAGIASSGDEILRQSFVDQTVLTEAVVEGYRLPLTVDGWERGLWRVTTAPRDNDLVANLEDIAQPTLLITGDADEIVPTAETEALVEEFSDGELVVVPRSGHLPHEERPEQFLTALLEWIGRTGT